jgi:ribosomal protein L11 methylase PrmA
MGRLSASFRDPSGFVFTHEGKVYRQVNSCYRPSYDQLMSSGLYDHLSTKGWLIPHTEIASLEGLPADERAHKLIHPKQIPYVSFPYEWSFNQLKDAALLTLKIAAAALQKNMSLKDASAYNVQFIGSQPVFIDTLSFEPYREGAPWVAYRQFCKHFLAPLALMAHADVSLSKLLLSEIDGIPLSLASQLLPYRTKLNYGLYTHIHLHAKTQQRFADAAETTSLQDSKVTSRRLSKRGLRAILESLASAVNKLHWRQPKTEWGGYYENTNYSVASAGQKATLVGAFLDSIPSTINTVHDLGANTGVFSEVASTYCKHVVSQDIDPVAVDAQYNLRKKRGPGNILPLLLNLTAPSPSIGWHNAERDGFIKRAQCDVVMALALVHHLAISNNTPLEHIAALFADLAPYLIIEFVPKSDTQVIRLLATRDDIFPDYHEIGFEQAFGKRFDIIKKETVEGSERTLYLLTRRASPSLEP